LARNNLTGECDNLQNILQQVAKESLGTEREREKKERDFFENIYLHTQYNPKQRQKEKSHSKEKGQR
jgi:hypothetical protein